MTEARPRPPVRESEPYAEVKQIGSVTYYITVHHGVMRRGGWTRLGLERARRKARRELARYKRRKGLEAVSWRIS